MCSTYVFFILLSFSALHYAHPQASSQYLQETIKDLHNLRTNSMELEVFEPNNNRRTIKVVTPPAIRRAHKNEESPPTLHLTKAELAALYEAAVAKGETVKLDPGDTGNHQINAVVHELDTSAETPNKWSGNEKDENGYYYYYYPLKSFMDEMSSGNNKPANSLKYEKYHHYHKHEQPKEEKKPPHMHTHMHQHNVKIEPVKALMEHEKKKGLEPLFMAITGFIGMALMFMFSIIVIPKLDKIKPKARDENRELINVTRLVLQAIEGRDCADRIACEMGKTALNLNLYNNRFVKLIKRMAPTSLARTIERIGKYTDKKHKCAAIQCKRKNQWNLKPKNKIKNENVKKNM